MKKSRVEAETIKRDSVSDIVKASLQKISTTYIV